jgi:hypothetical protein
MHGGDGFGARSHSAVYEAGIIAGNERRHPVGFFKLLHSKVSYGYGIERFCVYFASWLHKRKKMKISPHIWKK